MQRRQEPRFQMGDSSTSFRLIRNVPTPSPQPPTPQYLMPLPTINQPLLPQQANLPPYIPYTTNPEDYTPCEHYFRELCRQLINLANEFQCHAHQVTYVEENELGYIHNIDIDQKPIITFTDEDLPPEGANHNLPLCIIVQCNHVTVPGVLVDNGSDINVCPIHMAEKLGFDFGPPGFSPTTVRAYDNATRLSHGTVTLNIVVEGVEMKTIFHVLDIEMKYNLLLGRPWIHGMGAVPSTIHQKLKFILYGRIIKTVEAQRPKVEKEPSIFMIESSNLPPDAPQSSKSLNDKALEDATLNIAECISMEHIQETVTKLDELKELADNTLTKIKRILAVQRKPDCRWPRIENIDWESTFLKLQSERIIFPQIGMGWDPHFQEEPYHIHNYCKYHTSFGHHTNTCLSLKVEIRRLVAMGRITKKDLIEAGTIETGNPRFTSIPTNLEAALEILFEYRVLHPLPPKPFNPTKPNMHGDYCQYHRETGHTTNECRRLRSNIEWLIHQNIITYSDLYEPHRRSYDTSINAIEDDQGDIDPVSLITSIPGNPVEGKLAPFDFAPNSNLQINSILKQKGYFHGLGLGRDCTGIATFVHPPVNTYQFGLGYKPTKKEIEEFLAKERKRKANKLPIQMSPYELTLNGKFVQEGELFPYYGFLESTYSADQRRFRPGFEIFHDCYFLNPATPDNTEKDWINHHPDHMFGLLFNMESQPPAIVNDDNIMALLDGNFDPTLLIRPVFKEGIENAWQNKYSWTTSAGEKYSITIGHKTSLNQDDDHSSTSSEEEESQANQDMPIEDFFENLSESFSKASTSKE